MSDTNIRLNNLSVSQLNNIVQDFVDGTEISFFIYDAAGKLLVSSPEEHSRKNSSDAVQADQATTLVQQTALAALKRHELPPQSGDRCLPELIQHQEQIHGVIVGRLNLPINESQVVPLWKMIMRTARRRIEEWMAFQEETVDLSSEILHNYRELGLISKLSTQLAGLTTIERIYPTILEQTAQIVEADSGCIYSLDPSTQKLRIAQFYPEKVNPDAFESVQLGEGLIGQIAEARQPILIEGTQHPLWDSQAALPFKPPLMCCPIQINQIFLGIITVARDTANRVFTSGDLKILEAAALQSAAAVRNVRLLQSINQMRDTEARTQESLREKEVMLKEIHHRVKNNLQIISSLLDLQANSLTDPEILKIFNESQHRIRSMALIHEQLYQSEDFAKIDFAGYIQDLMYSLLHAYEIHPGYINYKIDADEIFLNINTAIPCGLILNELVSNALKHAFPDKRLGEVHILMRRESENQFLLIVRDNGVGFSGDLDIRNGKSLGLQLVSDLVNQISGTLTHHRSGGTTFKIRFPSKESVG